MPLPGGFRVGASGMQTDGVGGLRVGEEVTRGFQDEVRTANAFSLVIRLTTSALNQEGPARILSLSQGTGARNLTLGQEKDELVLRLRTTETGTNGLRPQITQCTLQAGEPVSLVFVYDADQGCRLYAGGREMEVGQVEGTLENWEAFPLVLGNETSGDRPWKGEIHRFDLRAGALDPETARTLSSSP
jgi:hypothetical protein